MSDLDRDTVINDTEGLPANPKYFPFLENLDLDQDVSSRISTLLRSTIAGNNQVYTTPLVKRVSPEFILSKVDELIESNSDRLNDQLLDLELSNRSKYGPRSIAKKWEERIDDVKSYYGNSSRTSNISTSWQNSKGKFRPISIEKGLNYLKNDTNSGLPFYTRKSIIKPRLLRDFNYLKYRKDPCILFTRTQEGGKTRNVWGYPAIDTLIEMCYYIPILDYQKKLNWRAAIKGPSDVDKEVSRILDFAIANSLSLVSIDFSSYDASISVALITKAFDYFKSLFQLTYHDTFDMICRRFYSMPILTPSGIFTGKHGVPSGSTFTNEVDSVVQYLIAKSSKLIYEDNFQIQGDDGIYAVAKSDVDDFLQTFTDEGLNVNKDKSIVADNYCIYLQKLYHPDFRSKDGIVHGIYPIYRAICRLVFQERWSKFEEFGISGQDYYSIRAICILENCKYHPLFEDFVKLVYELDKYSLGYSKDGYNKYIEMLKQADGSSGTIINQYGDDIKGIKSFQTVKVLNSLA